jgi:hypothetical protein
VRRLLALLTVAGLLVFAAAAFAHRPNSDAGGGEKTCRALQNASSFGPVGVGATDVRCRIARRVARESVRGNRVDGWACTGRGTRFGHCHGRGARRGKSVHWYAAH